MVAGFWGTPYFQTLKTPLNPKTIRPKLQEGPGAGRCPPGEGHLGFLLYDMHLHNLSTCLCKHAYNKEKKYAY